jgi:hypothetical protein
VTGPATGFFVSYTGADQAWAEWFADQLEAAGHPVVLQAWDFRPGEKLIGRERARSSRHALDRTPYRNVLLRLRLGARRG